MCLRSVMFSATFCRQDNNNDKLLGDVTFTTAVHKYDLSTEVALNKRLSMTGTRNSLHASIKSKIFLRDSSAFVSVVFPLRVVFCDKLNSRW